MNNFIRYSILLFFLSFAIKAFPAEHNFPCGDSKQIMLQNFKDGYAYFATATETNNFVIQLYINLENGDWRIVGIDNNMNACNILQGIDWQFIKVANM